MKIFCLTCAVVSMAVGLVWAAQEGPVAHWDFSEGKGDVLHDRSGSDNHGKIHGAKWIKNGARYALAFDGVDDVVDCGGGPSLDLRDQVSMMAWVKAEPRKAPGEPGIVGKAYASYVITQFYSKVYTYISGGPHHGFASMPLARWCHVASTYDGSVLKLYINGSLAAQNKLDLKVEKGGHFWMGRSDGEVRYTRNRYFRGQIAEVKVHNCTLSPEEIRHHLKTSNLTNAVDVSPITVPSQKKILVELDKRGLGKTPHGTRVDVRLYKVGPDGKRVGRALAHKKVSQFNRLDRASVVLPVGDLAAGTYQIHAVARKGLLKKIGVPGTARMEWPRTTRFPQGPKGARKLNNLVTELLNIRGPERSGKKYTFVNPRKGWIFISNNGSDAVTIAVEGAGKPIRIDLVEKRGDAHEAMRHLPAGTYTVGTSLTRRLIVRAIPQLIYASYNSNPKVREFGPYPGEFHQKYVLGNINTFNGWGKKLMSGEWIKRGGRWLTTCSVPTGTKEKPLTVEQAYQYIVKHWAFSDPRLSGLLADEFGNSQPHCAIWARAVDRALADPRFKDKVYYPYAGDLWTGEAGRELVAVIVKRKSGIAWKCYLKEQPTEAAAWRSIRGRLVDSGKQYREKCPGSLPHVIVCFGYFSAPPETLDTFPHVNYKTYLEMQVNLVAMDPALEDIGGLMSYAAAYADEETVRWMAHLFRYYAIEGNTEIISKDPYILTHLQNGDFGEKGRAWTLSPAAEGAIRFAISPGFGWLQGRYPRTSEGDTVIITKRSAQKPNTFSQTIRELQPGRTYSLRMFTGDFNDLSVKQKYAMSLKIDGVEILPDRSFTHVNANCYSHAHGPYDRKNKAWMNYHWRVFRAKGRTAQLTVSDWAPGEKPGGPIGQELMYNFVQVQPYLGE